MPYQSATQTDQLKERVADLYRQYEQPFYLFDMDELAKRSSWIRTVLPNRLRLLYSAKANPNLHIIGPIAESFDGVEVASIGEIAAARLAKVDGDQLVYVGPMKTRQDLISAYKAGVRRVVVESLDQLRLIANLEFWDMRVIVRVNPNLKINSSTIKMGGQPTQFGIDRDALDEVYDFFNNNSKLGFAGYHTYVGTQLESPSVTLAVVEEMTQVYFCTPEKLRMGIDFISFGGGFSFPMDHSPAPYPLEALAGQITEAVSAIPEHVQLVFELGRFVVAPVGYFCTRVQTLKHSKGKSFAICDSGINGFYGFASQSRFKRQNYPFIQIEAPFAYGRSMLDFNGDVVGPLCTPADSLASGIDVPKLTEGDILAFKNCGAYGLTHAMTMFLSHSPPLELGFNLDTPSHLLLRNSSQVLDSLRAQGADEREINEVLGLC